MPMHGHLARIAPPFDFTHQNSPSTRFGNCDTSRSSRSPKGVGTPPGTAKPMWCTMGAVASGGTGKEALGVGGAGGTGTEDPADQALSSVSGGVHGHWRRRSGVFLGLGGGGGHPVAAEGERVVLGTALAPCGPRDPVSSRPW